MSSRNNVLITIMHHLHGCEARVNANGLLVEGNIEGTVILEEDTCNKGLKCLAGLEYNTTKPLTNLHSLINNNKKDLGINYETLEKFHALLIENTPNALVQIATISPYSVKSFEVASDSTGKIQSLNIQYEDSIVRIYISKYPKPTE